jgi:cytoskeletal protein CcmA (bactofilin family)
MFRKKDNETPSRPTGPAEPVLPTRAAEPRAVSPQSGGGDLPRRQVDIPTPPSAAPVNLQADRDRQRAEAEAGKRLTVGPGISLSGEITACDRLVVQGSVQVTLNETRAIEIAESGRFTNGKAEVEEAEISGVYEGDLVVRNRLMIRSTGQVKGNVRFGEIEVERGGQITGSISMLEPSARTSPAGTVPPSPAPDKPA